MAEYLINKMPMKPDPTVWFSLLGAYRIHTNIELGETVEEHVFELDPKNVATYAEMDIFICCNLCRAFAFEEKSIP